MMLAVPSVAAAARALAWALKVTRHVKAPPVVLAWRARANRVGAPSPVRPRDPPGGWSLPLTPRYRWRLGSYVRLSRPSPRPLAGHDRPAQEELAAPDSPGLPPLQCSGEAGGPRRALPAQGLGRFRVTRRLGEEQFRVTRAEQVRTGARDRRQRCQSRRWHALREHRGRLRRRPWSGSLASHAGRVRAVLAGQENVTAGLFLCQRDHWHGQASWPGPHRGLAGRTEALQARGARAEPSAGGYGSASLFSSPRPATHPVGTRAASPIPGEPALRGPFTSGPGRPWGPFSEGQYEPPPAWDVTRRCTCQVESSAAGPTTKVSRQVLCSHHE
jgi:hypothetical protein